MTALRRTVRIRRGQMPPLDLQTICDKCDKFITVSTDTHCQRCDGSGVISRRTKGKRKPVEVPCPACDGKGNKCQNCDNADTSGRANQQAIFRDTGYNPDAAPVAADDATLARRVIARPRTRRRSAPKVEEERVKEESSEEE